jgi:hypothetical protein
MRRCEVAPIRNRRNRACRLRGRHYLSQGAARAEEIDPMVTSSISYQILFPAPYRIELTRLRQQLEEAHFAWVQEWKQRQADFRIENIRFNHDPLWNKRVFSLQAARDGGTWFWRATRAVVFFGGFSI